MAPGILLSSLFFIVLSNLSSASNGGINDKDQWLSQPQASVSVIIGEVLHLECKVHNKLPPGPVKWFLGEGTQRKLIYADAEIDKKDERITRNSPGSNTDFSISIHNVTLEDAGTYYCVKQLPWGSRDWLKGPGTQVVVTRFRNPFLHSGNFIPGSPGLTTIRLATIPSYNGAEKSDALKRPHPGLTNYPLSGFITKHRRNHHPKPKLHNGTANQSKRTSRDNDLIVPLAVGISGCILVCLFCVALCVYLNKKKALRNNHARSDAVSPEKQPPSKPTSGDKEVVYADLKDPSKLQIPRRIDSEERSEYATIKGAPTAASDKGTFYSLNL